MIHGRHALSLLPLLLSLGCGNGQAGMSPTAIVPFAPGDNGPPPLGDIPWPSDLYLNEMGRIGEIPHWERVSTQPSAIQEGLSELDGFGRASGALFFLPDPVDPESLPSTLEEAEAENASVLIVDVDPASPNHGKRYPAVAKALSSLSCISVLPLPGFVLPQGVKHAVVLTSAVTTTTAIPLSAAPELQRIAAESPEERKTAAEKLYGDAIADLLATKALSDISKLASLAVFTTSKRVEEMPVLRTRLRQEPEPTVMLNSMEAAPYSVATFGIGSTPSLDDWLGTPSVDEKGVEWPGGDNPTGIAHDAIAVVASGAFIAPSFMDSTSKHFERDASGAYILANANAKIPVTVVIPKAPMPPAGYPVIINGHGMSNNRGSMLSLANELARAGFAMIGIDDVLHGARAGIEDVKNNFKGTYVGPDGIPDRYPTALSFFAEFSDFIVVRDNFRQTILDQMSLVRLIQSSKLDLSPLAAAAGGQTPKLDGAHIYWSGGSLGGIMGTMAVALEPEIKGAAFQVPGASFVQLIASNSAEFSGLVGTVAKGSFGLVGEEILDEFHPIANFLGTITESGDPIGYAPHILHNPLLDREPPDLLVTYALDDEVMPNISTMALIRAIGLDLATPNLREIPGVSTVASPVQGNRGARTAAAVQYAPAEHALGYMRYDERQYAPSPPVGSEARFSPLPMRFLIEMPIRAHSAELAKFFSTAYAGSAQIEVTAPPIADFDGDGTLDANDPAPYEPTVK